VPRCDAVHNQAHAASSPEYGKQRIAYHTCRMNILFVQSLLVG
jgi:hypothetical protein